MKKLYQTIGTYLLLPFLYFFSYLPYFILYRISDVLFFLIYHVFKYRVSVVYENLKNSFPEKSEKEILKIQKDFYKNLSDIFVETIKAFTVSPRRIKKRLKVVNPELIRNYYDRNRSVMVMMGHFNNWEHAIAVPLWMSHECWVVYNPLSNVALDKIIRRSREKFGFHLISMGDTFRTMLKHKQGDKLYGFITDQSPHHGSINYWLNFLNQDTPVHTGAENISRKLDLVVAFMEIRKIKRGYYEVVFKILFENPKETAKHEITDSFYANLEEIIRKNPSQYLWSHRRWKYKRP